MSTKLEEMISSYKELSVDDKKEKLVNIAKKITPTNPVLQNLISTIESNPNVDDDFCVGTYQDIMTFADNVSKKNKDAARESLSRVHDQMKKLHMIEERQRLNEDADGDLENALSSL